MSAWTRVVSRAIALVGIVGVGASAEADAITGSMSRANMATGLPTWMSATRARAAGISYNDNPPAVPIVPSTPQPQPQPPVSVPVVAAPSAPVFASYPATTTASAPVSSTPAPAPISLPTVSTPVYNAFVNLGTGPYPEASLITSGNAQPWYNSPAISGFFGGQAPNAQQQADFSSTVMQRVEQTFSNSGVAIALTSNPNDIATHTLSLVSNTSAQILPAAIGMTDVGGNGFSFIDQEAKAAGSLDQLEWIVAHNISHELMLTMGVGENYDTTGNYIDARNANLSMMLNPSSTFSQAAAAALNQAISAADSNGSTTSLGTSAQVLNLEAQIVPEPGSLVVWGLLALGIAVGVRAKG